MPFINIIEQNYETIMKNFGLNEENGEIRKIYSGTEFIFDSDNYSKAKFIMDDSTFNYPVICTTFSTLFDSIISNKKRYKYKLSSLTNSVIILDEIQSLPLDNWSSLYFLINEIADKYNIYFIIMSATLPSFNKLKLNNNEIKQYNVNYLIDKPKKYFNHSLFDRTSIIGDIQELSIDDEEEIRDYLINDIIKPNFEAGYSKGLIVLNTIKSSQLIFDILKREFVDLNIDLLNSSLLPSTKKEVIYNIKNSSDKKYLLISTQSIEAGVDVSFDFVVRDFTILDSIEQIRGRCNRNRELNKENSLRKGNIHLINLKNSRDYLHNYIYSETERKTRLLETIKILKDNLNYSYEDILKYYDNVSNRINHFNESKEDDFIFNDWDNIKNWNMLHYSKLQDNKHGINIINNRLNQYSHFKIFTFTPSSIIKGGKIGKRKKYYFYLKIVKIFSLILLFAKTRI